MNISDQIDAFALEIDTVIDRFIAEFDLPNAAIIGALEMAKMNLFQDMLEQSQTDDSDE